MGQLRRIENSARASQTGFNPEQAETCVFPQPPVSGNALRRSQRVIWMAGVRGCAPMDARHDDQVFAQIGARFRMCLA